ncbi:MAG: hypothetical protein ACR2MB_13295 [Acidimicrobiales bacterium]
MFFLVVLLLVLAATGAVVYYALLARQAVQGYKASNQVVPGRPTSAPSSWAGSHDACALLHRRLIVAMAALRANQAFDDDGALLDLRVELEQQALAIDERLVAIDALPAPGRAEPLTQVTAATAAIEQAVTDLASRSVADLKPAVDAALADLRERTTALDDIRRELDATDPSVVGPGATSTDPTSTDPTRTDPTRTDPPPGTAAEG